MSAEHASARSESLEKNHYQRRPDMGLLLPEILAAWL